ncbi:MAG TPA: exonuclease domain-containing protein, partial [Bdellovibrionota bacterium]|nr:exonuclease domain-containing protein [Bdellovibrionota bacterium]
MAEDQPKSFVVLDFETTGLDPRSSEILEAGAVRVSIPDLRILERWESLVKPVGGVPPFISRLTGIEPEHVADAPPWEEVRPKLLEFLGDSPIAAHNSAMEQSFLEAHASRIAGEWDIWDTLEPLTLALPELPSHSLENLRAQAGLVSEGSHRALKDAEDTALLLKYAQDKLLRDRPGVAATVKELQEGREEWVWSWLFEAVAPAEAPGEVEPPFWGDLRKLKAQDQSREPEWNKSVTTDEVGALLREGVARAGLEYRTVQERMAADVAKALLVGERVAIEAPTGTGKSVAYLLPGVLAAERTGAPLVVATHSKGLQDQLLNKDVPAVARLLGRTGDGAEDGQPGVRAAVVKGQNNYLCLRKFH